MPDKPAPDLSLFLDILKTLEGLRAPYMIIGAFAGTVYGITRVTYDIDMVVDLSDAHINALSAHYPLPRYYADPEMIRNSIALGIMFNIIDTERGEKADLVPLSGTPSYYPAFQRRIRQLVEIPGAEPFEVWCAQPDDVIYGKLLAWDEGRSRKHEGDILEMLTYHYAKRGIHDHSIEESIERILHQLSEETILLWQTIKSQAQKEAGKE